MNAKNLVAAALLLFVVASVVILIRREMQVPTADPSAVDAVAVADQTPEDGLVVYYFHGDTRCRTCLKIENYAHEAVESAFVTELAEDKVVWKAVNYELPENSHFATEYELVSPTVVLVRTVDGKASQWRNLARVWKLVGDREAFIEYVQTETSSMLGS
jgi:hypothetical protein